MGNQASSGDSSRSRSTSKATIDALSLIPVSTCTRWSSLPPVLLARSLSYLSVSCHTRARRVSHQWCDASYQTIASPSLVALPFEGIDQYITHVLNTKPITIDVPSSPSSAASSRHRRSSSKLSQIAKRASSYRPARITMIRGTHLPLDTSLWSSLHASLGTCEHLALTLGVDATVADDDVKSFAALLSSDNTTLNHLDLSTPRDSTSIPHVAAMFACVLSGNPWHHHVLSLPSQLRYLSLSPVVIPVVITAAIQGAFPSSLTAFHIGLWPHRSPTDHTLVEPVPLPHVPSAAFPIELIRALATHLSPNLEELGLAYIRAEDASKYLLSETHLELMINTWTKLHTFVCNVPIFFHDRRGQVIAKRLPDNNSNTGSIVSASMKRQQPILAATSMYDDMNTAGFPVWRSLTHLDYTCNRGMLPAGVAGLLAICGNVTLLQLNDLGVYVRQADFPMIVACLPPRLCSLSIHDWMMVDISNEVARQFPTTLKYLACDGIDVEDDILSNLASSLHSLQSLVIELAELRHKNILRLAHLKHLHHLNAMITDDRGLRAFVTQWSQTLQSFTTSFESYDPHNGMKRVAGSNSNSMAAKVCAALPSMVQLRRLEIKRCDGLTRTQLANIASCTRLQHLHLPSQPAAIAPSPSDPVFDPLRARGCEIIIDSTRYHNDDYYYHFAASSSK